MPRDVDRRTFVQSLLGAPGATAAGPYVHPQPQIRWRLASRFPRTTDVIYGAAEEVAARVAELTDDRFQIQVYPANELVPALQVLGAVRNGTAEMGHSGSLYYIGKQPAFAFDTGIPFGLTPRQRDAWMLHGGGLSLMRRLFSDFNIINFLGGHTGVQMGGWFRTPIKSVDDLQGLKMRIPGLGGKVMDRLGVNVQVLAGPEIYPALDRGVLDATEWVGPNDDEKLGLHEVATYYYYPGWWETDAATTFYVNQDAWADLPSSYQEALRTAMREASVHMLAKYDAKDPAALERLLQKDVDLRRFPDPIMQRALEETTAILEDYAAKDPTYRKVYRSWKNAHEQAYQWSGISQREALVWGHRLVQRKDAQGTASEMSSE